MADLKMLIFKEIYRTKLIFSLKISEFHKVFLHIKKGNGVSSMFFSFRSIS